MRFGAAVRLSCAPWTTLRPVVGGCSGGATAGTGAACGGDEVEGVGGFEGAEAAAFSAGATAAAAASELPTDPELRDPALLAAEVAVPRGVADNAAEDDSPDEPPCPPPSTT